MSQECQQPQAHPARCGCEQKKPYPDRLCHIDYTAHPYRCGCLKGNAEAQSRFDEHQHHASAPSAGREVDNSPDGVRLEVFEIVCKERDALKAEVERLNELLAKEGRHFDAVWQKGLDLQSELTKARELLNLLYWGNVREPTEADCVEIERQINVGLAHQSAPAAKGEDDE